MRALTLHQPWASAIFAAEDPKDIENRTRLRPPKELLTGRRIGSLELGRPIFAIHAGMTYDMAPAKIAELRARGEDVSVVTGLKGRWGFPAGARVPSPEECPQGAVIGVARIRHGYDARTRTALGVDDPPRGLLKAEMLPLARWWLGPIGVRLMDVVALTEPVPCRGMLGYWTLPEDVEELVRKRIPVW